MTGPAPLTYNKLDAAILRPEAAALVTGSSLPMKALLSPLYGLLEVSSGYSLLQKVAAPTVRRFRDLIADNVRLGAGDAVLDLACGTGAYRDCFGADYTGIDINPHYIADARAALPGRFEVMDCTELTFPDASFDAVVSIAATHHLDEAQLRATVREALRVCRPGGAVHLIDAVLPFSPVRAFKTAWFRLDRGAYPRKLDDLLGIIGGEAPIEHHDAREGPLHDVVCVRLRR